MSACAWSPTRRAHSTASARRPRPRSPACSGTPACSWSAESRQRCPRRASSAPANTGCRQPASSRCPCLSGRACTACPAPRTATWTATSTGACAPSPASGARATASRTRSSRVAWPASRPTPSRPTSRACRARRPGRGPFRPVLRGLLRTADGAALPAPLAGRRRRRHDGLTRAAVVAAIEGRLAPPRHPPRAAGCRDRRHAAAGRRRIRAHGAPLSPGAGTVDCHEPASRHRRRRRGRRAGGHPRPAHTGTAGPRRDHAARAVDGAGRAADARRAPVRGRVMPRGRRSRGSSARPARHTCASRWRPWTQARAPSRRAAASSCPTTRSLLALGAVPVAAYEHATTFSPADPDALAGLLRDLEEGYSSSVAFVVPTRPGVAVPRLRAGAAHGARGERDGRGRARDGRDP